MGGHQSKSVTKEVHIDEKELDKISNVYVKAPDEPFQNGKNDINYYNIQSITNIIIIFFLILFIILSFYLMCFKIIYK
jgi:hypothetical protein